MKKSRFTRNMNVNKFYEDVSEEVVETCPNVIDITKEVESTSTTEKVH